MKPESLDQWFPLERQRHYVALLSGRIGITRRRAEYFVRLWAYLLLKQRQSAGKRLELPLAKLELPQGLVPCTHHEAATLFYGQQDRGSDRAAGMMLEKLTALGLIEKRFDGNVTCIQIQPQPELTRSPRPTEPVQLQTDAFNPRTDTIPVANMLARNYNWMNKNTEAVPYKIARLLRQWAEQYPKSMRVLRRCDTLNPIGFYILYPTAQQSEVNFFLAPSKSLHLSSASDIDPMIMAVPGALDCTSVFVRSWMIDAPYMQHTTVANFLKDAQEMLVQMQTDFPNLCDLYGLVIHPNYEALTLALGFQRMNQDSQLSVYWMYLAIDRFLALDIAQAIAVLQFETTETAIAHQVI